ncbi:MAG: glycosyltransferase family 4 protein [Bacteroidaceae bacterium]|nr:glycosyltransferase family 4 protein [Bacteroidaceae bacterium]
MKIVYLYTALVTVGGADRVVTEKANYLAEVLGHDVYIITDSQNGRQPVFPLSTKVKHIDLDINFDKQYHHGLLVRAYYYFSLMYLYKKRLGKLLNEIKADVVITTLGRDLDFLTTLEDGSKKVGESHIAKQYTRNFHLMESRGFPYRQIAKYWRRKQEKAVRRLDAFVVLTQYDAESWSKIKAAEIIPNSLPFYTEESSTLDKKQIITVGRLSEQKGFDLLISAWSCIARQHSDWKIHLYGEGELENELRKSVAQNGMEDSFLIHKPVKDIKEKYLESSIYVMSSRFEGFGMVLIEAMACGVPCVSFDCPHGPSYIVKDGEDGILVENGNVEKLADAISSLIVDKERRMAMGKAAKRNIARYSQKDIMRQWENLFYKLTS